MIEKPKPLAWYWFNPGRAYDPMLGRWMNVDPHSASYPSMTPYNYVGNNPLRFIDPTGMDSTDSQNNTVEASTAIKILPLILPALEDGVLCLLGGLSILLTIPSDTPIDRSQALQENGKTVEDLKNESTPGEETKGKSKNKDMEDGFDKANKDFDSLNPSDVQKIPKGRTGNITRW